MDIIILVQILIQMRFSKSKYPIVIVPYILFEKYPTGLLNMKNMGEMPNCIFSATQRIIIVLIIIIYELNFQSFLSLLNDLYIIEIKHYKT